MSSGRPPRVHLLTGCASGIGWHLLQCLAQRGEKVLATDVDIEKLRELIKGLDCPDTQILSEQLDVRDPAQWEYCVSRAVDHFGRLDVLMNIAGVTLAAPIHETPMQRVDFHMDINAKGVMYGCIAVSKVMHAQKSGHIINIASAAGLVPVPYMSLYSASKFAVRGFSLAIANELAEHGVAVTVLCPDAVDTPMLEHEALDEHATFTFAGNVILSLKDIEDAIFKRALPKRPREIILAGPTGFMMRWACAYPKLFDILMPYYKKQGERTRIKYIKKLESKKGS